jgi:hypothetical protein
MKKTRSGTHGGRRRLIAGLRVTAEDELLLAVVRPFVADASSEGELAYRLWRRGLEVTLAEVAGLGAELPAGVTEAFVARLVTQRLLLSLPLLRRTGTLALLGIDAAPPQPGPPLAVSEAFAAAAAEAIDATASATIAGLGGGDFL